MIRFALLMLVPLIAGCDVHSKKSASNDDKVNIKADASGNVAFDLPFAKGQVKLPAGFMDKGDVDIDGVKLMPGSQVTGFTVDSQGKLTNVDMSFTAPAAPDQVRAYFLGEFKKRGAEASLSGDTVSGKSKDGNPFTIKVSPAGKGSQGTIRIQDRD
jgi:hypothetical protein